jgi:hypothetical protein
LNRKKKKKKENSIPVHTIKAAIEVNKNKREKKYIYIVVATTITTVLQNRIAKLLPITKQKKTHTRQLVFIFFLLFSSSTTLRTIEKKKGKENINICVYLKI